jgi:hypothetical protein
MSAQLAAVLPLVPEPASLGLILHVDDDEGLRRSTATLLRSRDSRLEKRAAVKARSPRSRHCADASMC